MVVIRLIENKSLTWREIQLISCRSIFLYNRRFLIFGLVAYDRCNWKMGIIYGSWV